MIKMTLRPGKLGDLDAINRIITRAIGTWNVSERVKRLSLPIYHYQDEDLDHLELLMAMNGDEPLAVAAWEPAEAKQLPAEKSGMLLHGLYVDPEVARGGIGSILLNACRDAADQQGFDGVLVKATRDAVGFFERRGLILLPVLREGRDYDLRYWLPIDR